MHLKHTLTTYVLVGDPIAGGGAVVSLGWGSVVFRVTGERGAQGGHVTEAALAMVSMYRCPCTADVEAV